MVGSFGWSTQKPRTRPSLLRPQFKVPAQTSAIITNGVQGCPVSGCFGSVVWTWLHTVRRVRALLMCAAPRQDGCWTRGCHSPDPSPQCHPLHACYCPRADGVGINPSQTAGAQRTALAALLQASCPHYSLCVSLVINCCCKQVPAETANQLVRCASGTSGIPKFMVAPLHRHPPGPSGCPPDPPGLQATCF